jgi:hypothetical protein
MATSVANHLDIAEEYLAAWKHKDIHRIAKLVHCDIELTTPVAKASGSRDFLASCERIFPMLEDVRLRAKFADEHQAMLAYDFVFKPPTGVIRAANLMTFEDGVIRSIELFLDPRPLEKSSQEPKQTETHPAHR